MGFINRLFGKDKPSDPNAYLQLIGQSMEELRLKTEAHDATWHLGEADWSVDQKEGTIIFTSPRGIVATCPVQIIGTYNTADNTWLWGWDHPSVVLPLQKHARRVMEYGQANDIDELTSRKLSISEDKAWEFAALACKLCDAQGAYRGPAGPALIYMTFGTVQLNKSDTTMETSRGEQARVLPSTAVPAPEEIHAFVVSFIAALHQWEIEAYKNSSDDLATNQWEFASNTYANLIDQWCDESVTPQPVSFGSNPNHHPDRESVLAATVNGDQAVVFTTHTNDQGFESDYEYHLRKCGGRWYVISLLYVADGEQFEML